MSKTILSALPGIKLVAGWVGAALAAWGTAQWIWSKGSMMNPTDIAVLCLLLAALMLTLGNFIHWWELGQLKKTLPDEVRKFDKDRIAPNFKSFAVHVFVHREMAKELAVLCSTPDLRLLPEETIVTRAISNVRARFGARFAVNPKTEWTSDDGSSGQVPNATAYSLTDVTRALDRWALDDLTHI